MLSTSDIIALLGSNTLISAAIAGLFVWVGARIAERINLEWKQNTDKQLEQLRADVTRNSAILDAAISNFGQGYHAAQERRLKAIEAVWNAICGLKAIVDPAFLFYSLFPPSEYKRALDLPAIAAGISKLDRDDILYGTHALMKTVEPYRPFLGENIWTLYFTYQTVIDRARLCQA